MEVETLRRALLAVPEGSTLAMLALALPASVAVTAGVFRPWLVVAASAAAFAALWWLCPPRAPAAGASVAATLVAVVGTAGWTAVQLHSTGEYVTVDRDPAVYALTALWLVDNPSVAVPMTEAAQAAADVPGARTVGLGFGQSSDPLHPEFVHTVPAMAAVAGWLGGTDTLLRAPVVLGAAALLGVYSLGRRLLGDWWALLPPAALAVAMPLVAFSRSIYSEPLTLAVVAAGAALLVGLLDGTAPRPGRTAVLAGLYLGAAGLARIDGALFVAGGLAAVAAWVVLAGPRREDARSVLRGVAAPAVALVGLGMTDMAVNSGNYLARHGVQAGLAVGAMVAAALLGWLALGAAPRIRAWLAPRRQRVAAAGAALVALVTIGLLSRPLWLESRTFANDEQMTRDIAQRQAEEGLALDGTRSYDELTLEWAAWYHGWLAVGLGLLGIVVLTYQALAGRRPGVLAVLLTLGAPALLYVVRPSITPDHVWAMRRLVTAVVPLLLVAGTALLARLARSSRLGLLAGVGAALVVLGWPLAGWSGLVQVRDRVGQVDEAEAACAHAGDGRVVLANGAPGVDYLPTVRVVCDAQVVALSPTTQESLAQLRRAWGGGPLALVTFDVDAMPWTQRPTAPVHEAELAMWERSLIGAPSRPTVWERTMWAGTVLPDGRVEPVPSLPPSGG